MATPTLLVQLDDGTGTFPIDITSKCLLAPGFSFSRGREDWQSEVTTGELSLTLNNCDGRFTPGSTILRSPSPIKVDQRIRLRETVNGVAFTRFTGYVKSWPVAWPATVATFATVRVTATDAQAQAERWPLQSFLLEELALDSPAALYRCDEPAAAASAGDSSGNQAVSLSLTGSGAPVTFGASMANAFAAVQFNGGQYLTGPAAPVGGISCTIQRDTHPAATETVLVLGGLVIEMNASGFLGMGGGFLTLADVADGQPHQVAVTWDGAGNVSLWANAATTLTSPLATPVGNVTIGGGSGASFGGMIANIAYFNSVPTAVRIAAYANALAGFPGEFGTARLLRIISYTNIAAVGFDASLTNLPASELNMSLADAVRQVADAEMGLAFFNGAGALIFHNRNRVVSKLTPDLTIAASFLTADPTALTDDVDLINHLEVTAAGTQAAQLVKDATSETTHGRYDPGSRSYLVQTDQEAVDRGNWIIFTHKEAGVRYGTLTINLLAMSAAQAQAAIAAIEPSCWLRVTSMPSQNTGGTTADVIVQGFAEERTDSTWTLTCNVSDKATLYPTPWILGDATYSVLGSTTRLYV